MTTNSAQRTSSDLVELSSRLSESLGIPDPVEDVYALSPFQEGILFEVLASRAPDLYLVQHRVRIDGALDLDQFRRAWSFVFDRHPGLRTIFLARGAEKPLQVVCRSVPVEIELIDLVEVADPDEAVEARCREDRAKPFALSEPPLMRLMLFRRGPEHHELVTSQPHLLLDGWSNMVVFNEVFEAYAALIKGESPVFEPAAVARTFIDWVEGQEPESAEQFWRHQLEGFVTPTRITRTDEAGDEPRGDDYLHHTCTFASELTASIRALARKNRVSLGAVLAGAVAVLLGRYNGRPDIVFCIVAAGRPAMLPGVESMVGTFINVLPLRVHIDEASSIADWLRDVHLRQSKLLAHETSPLSQVQAWSEMEPGIALSDTMLSFNSFSGGSRTSAEIEYRPSGGFGRTGFPLSLTVEGVDPMTVGLSFEATDFDLESAALLLSRLENILRSMVARPEGLVRDLELLTASEIHALTTGVRLSSRVPIRDVRVHELIAEQSARTPTAPALVCGAATLTYQELEAESNRLAHHLLSVGARRGSHVAVCLSRSIDFPVALLAVHKAGAAFVPLDPTLPVERLKYMTLDASVDVLLSTQTILTSSFLEYSGTVVALDLERKAIRQRPDKAPAVQVGRDDLSHVYYTSGSTGQPKGAAIEHEALTNCLTSLARVPGVTAADTILSVTAPTFDPVLMELFVPLIVGGVVVLATDEMLQDSNKLLQALDQYGVTMMFATPTRWRLLLGTGWRGKHDLTVASGGEAMSEELASTLLSENRAVWNLYGPTEATIWSSVGAIHSGKDARTIGDPIANSWFYVLDDELRPMPQGRTGELFIGGVGLAREYIGRPEQTARNFIADPFDSDGLIYRTGDLARVTDLGIEFFGRRDQQVKIRGHRVELGEVESVLTGHPSLFVAAARIVRYGPGDDRLVAYHVSPSPTPPTDHELREHLRAQLPEYMVPQHFIQIEELPLNSTGKLDRKRLPDPFEGELVPPPDAQPRTEGERLVATCCRDLLRLASVDLRHHFFDLGGHSLLSMRMIALLKERTGVRIDPRTLLLNTLQQVANEIDRRRSAGPDRSGNDSSGPEVQVSAGSQGRDEAFFFGRSDEPIFGIHYRPSAVQVRAKAVLICGPIGWEYTHTHLALRGLARRLAFKGFHVLRFDFSATGDSWGDDNEISFLSWVDDIATASAELRGRSRSGQFEVIGLRIGATAAAVACAGGLQAERLILWDPVIEGASYIRSQERMDKLHRSGSSDKHGRSGSQSPLEDEDLLGQAFPVGFRRELDAIDLRKLAPWTIPTVMVSSMERSLDRDLTDASGPDFSAHLVEDVGNWEDLATRDALVLPSKIPGYIVDLLAGES